MKRALLVADSGGSKTDWCLVDHLGNQKYFTTDSYHPHIMTDQWIASKKEFWRDYTEVYNFDVHFYGAGCLKEHNRQLVEEAFRIWGIHNIKVNSDLLGAAISLFGDKDGVIGILGTGSVLAQIEQNNISKVIGGFGHILGDEGSGYHFGKLLLSRYFHNEFSGELNELIELELGSKELILKNVYAPDSKKYISSLSAQFSKYRSDEIMAIHEENINLFVDFYIAQLASCQKISFVGSYAFYNAEIIRKVLAIKGVDVEKILERPIEQLTEYFVRGTF
jgi:hypothetical protein